MSISSFLVGHSRSSRVHEANNTKRNDLSGCTLCKNQEPIYTFSRLQL